MPRNFKTDKVDAATRLSAETHGSDVSGPLKESRADSDACVDEPGSLDEPPMASRTCDGTSGIEAMTGTGILTPTPPSQAPNMASSGAAQIRMISVPGTPSQEGVDLGTVTPTHKDDMFKAPPSPSVAPRALIPNQQSYTERSYVEFFAEITAVVERHLAPLESAHNAAFMAEQRALEAERVARAEAEAMRLLLEQAREELRRKAAEVVREHERTSRANERYGDLKERYAEARLAHAARETGLRQQMSDMQAEMQAKLDAQAAEYNSLSEAHAATVKGSEDALAALREKFDARGRTIQRLEDDWAAQATEWQDSEIDEQAAWDGMKSAWECIQ